LLFKNFKEQKKRREKMKLDRANFVVTLVFGLFLMMSISALASTEQYTAMKGVDSAKAFFDMRVGVPKSAAIHMNLIYDTYKELTAMKKKPVFVVLFIGSAVKLISGNRSEFKPEDQKYLKEIAETVSAMSKAGIRLEVCLTAARYFGVDPASIQSEIMHVGNGWISEIGYQTRGYQLVPVY
jgi:intracellular sulfur oxidation DsrE/DsrF family protein